MKYKLNKKPIIYAISIYLLPIIVGLAVGLFDLKEALYTQIESVKFFAVATIGSFLVSFFGGCFRLNTREKFLMYQELMLVAIYAWIFVFGTLLCIWSTIRIFTIQNNGEFFNAVSGALGFSLGIYLTYKFFSNKHKISAETYESI